ncbi:uncharacterized protein BO97DRAFT_413771 [Aspergillus homomorphus CBS 101889]|uniref:Uncharacterized protein n=1 Tax=Aspergillus homomorphus (strain CBS 101889) TaxID=1450537 RepID=A0A395HY37_ASPHC|nr:hypothetical protein BO97DRAFT_413771 [Aspergillus homomorphus CBS 101889]RAL12841.1 hypothetical protein BO97DRAFT_413771 [Aspergillus homomorphus CBS 101889]
MATNPFGNLAGETPVSRTFDGVQYTSFPLRQERVPHGTRVDTVLIDEGQVPQERMGGFSTRLLRDHWRSSPQTSSHHGHGHDHGHNQDHHSHGHGHSHHGSSSHSHHGGSSSSRHGSQRAPYGSSSSSSRYGPSRYREPERDPRGAVVISGDRVRMFRDSARHGSPQPAIHSHRDETEWFAQARDGYNQPMESFLESLRDQRQSRRHGSFDRDPFFSRR